MNCESIIFDIDGTLWNEVYVDMADTAEALETAQDSIESDLF